MENKLISRPIDDELLKWKHETSRKPLLLRGARQVGKSTAVKALSIHFDNYLEINFELNADVHAIFKGNLEPSAICENLSGLFGISIITGKTLLFFDEIQACIQAISSLRYFYEKMPKLHVIAAGSLLEFALEELPSFGVGRVRSVFMYPFSFDEFLNAMGHGQLIAIKKQNKPLLEPIHNKLIALFKKYILVGGMPEAVAKYCNNPDLNEVQKVLGDLVFALKADFSKYKNRVPSARISEVFDSVVNQTGGKFNYSKTGSEANHKQLKEAINLLIMAGLIIPVTHTAANGLPLGAEIDSKKRKFIVLDTGIFQRILDLNIGEIIVNDDFDVINKGNIAEMIFGLEWLKYCSPYRQDNLYYWHREIPMRNAEVDYVIQKNELIVPIEVKASNKGAMQSMHVFLEEKKLNKGIRVSLENFSEYGKIKVIPIYAISTLREMVF
jgi:uncharacterized protein